jgi:hypothetical protein
MDEREHELGKRTPASWQAFERIDREGWESVRGARVTTEIAQLHRCTQNHDFMVHLQDGGYAILFERGLERLAQGRTRDAVIDGYSAFEMFLSWLVLGCAFDRRYPLTIPLDQAPLEPLREELKPAIKTAERATGAALALAAALSGKAPPKIPSKLSELRNEAVHAGNYPTDKQAEDACLAIEKLVVEFRQLVPQAFDEGTPPIFSRFGMALLLESRRRALGTRPQVQTTSYSLSTVLATDATPGARTATDRLKEYRSGDRPFLID